MNGLHRDNMSSVSQEEQQQARKPITTRRKFAVSPVETSARSSKDTAKADKSRKSPVVEPVEVPSRKSRDVGQQKQLQPTKPKRRFAPQMVETSATSSRQRKDSIDDSPTASRQSSTSSRKFQPELVETAKGSFRKKPSASPSAIPAYLREDIDMQEEGGEGDSESGESRFSAANIAKRSKKDPRRHSYCIPDLPVIQSDSSGEESARSLSSSPDVPNMFHQHERHRRPHPKIQPESAPLPLPTQFHVDDRSLRDQAIAAYISAEAHVPFNHYGGDSDDEDDRRSLTGKFTTDASSRPSMFRRSSDVDLHLAQADMRLHRIAFERAKAEYEADTAGASRFSSAAIAARHRLGVHHPEGTTLHQRNHVIAVSPVLGTPTKTPAASPTGAATPDTDVEYRRAREAARPPMLGEELKFPFTVSPRMTRCDVDQVPRPRRNDSGDGSGSRDDNDGNSRGVKLWAADVSVNTNATAGLWGGLCQASNTKVTEQPSTPLRSGLQTPAYEHDNPFSILSPPPTSTQAGVTGGLWGSHTGSKTPAGARTPGRKLPPQPLMPLTPPRTSRDMTSASDAFTASLDKKLALETLIEDEFPPHVITQIYNYLSLGYPPLARPFDAELSKISRIPVSELRKADRSGSGQVKGYIGTPERESEADERDTVDIDPDTGTVRGCRRWEALRAYVKEWARQSPNFASERAFCEGGGGSSKRRDVGAGQWGGGAGVRKGSWGF